MLGGKKKYKCRFDVKVEKIEGLPDKIKGNPFRVEYARGKDQSGISRTLTMISKNMAVNYSFKLECNLMFEEKKGVRKFAEKSLTFQVVAEKSKEVKKEANIGKAEFDLAAVAVPGEFEAKQRIECHGKDKSDVKCVLVVSFKTEVIKIDGKKLVKSDPSKPKATKEAKPASPDADPYGDLPDFGDDPASSGSRTVNVDGQEYDLQTDTDLSEAGVESDNDAKTENDYLSDSDDDKNDPFEQDAEPTEEEKRLAKKVEEEDKKAADEAKRADEAKKAEEAKRAADEAKKADEAAKDAAKKAGDEKKAKEEEKKRKEEEEKRKKEEDKKRKEDEKRAKEEEDKRKKEEDKKRKGDEKRAKEEEDRRKKQEKADRAAGVASSAPASTSTSPSVSTKDKDSSATGSSTSSKSSKDGGSKSDLLASSAASGAAVAALEAQIKTLTEERDAAKSEAARLSSELESEKKNVGSLKKELKSAETATKDAESRLKREESKSADLASDNKRMQERLAAASGSSSATSNHESIDAAEITRLEGQMRKLRQDNQTLQDELDDTKKKLRQTEAVIANHDAGYAAKQIGDLETENAKLRQVLDDHDLLKGNLIQELKHRQSERHIRVEKHQKDIESGSASAEEITSYKRHSRQSSMDSTGGKSPRLNGSAGTSAKSSKADTKTTEKPQKESSSSLVAPEPKKPKKPTISMDDDSSPATTRAGSKRASMAPTPSILEEGDQFMASDANEKIRTLETRLTHDETIESCFYNAMSEYDEAGLSLAAQKMAHYVLRAKALDRKEQHTESSHSLLVHVLTAVYGQIQRHNMDLDVLVGILQWATALLQILQRETDILEDAPPASHMTWAADIEACGVVLKFDAVIDAADVFSGGKFLVQKTFDDIASDATPGEAFLQLLDQMISYTYVIIFGYMQSLFDEAKLAELFFGQTSQLAAALNGSNPNARGAGGKKPSPPKPMSSFTSALEPALTVFRRHNLNSTVEAQFLAQFFFWCSSNIVNALVAQTEHCCAAVGMSLKVAVSHVEQWISQNANRRLSGWIEDQFVATREAANVLTIDKQIFQSIDALEGIFTTLNIAQIHKLLSQFQTDDFCPDPVPRTTLDVLRNTINKTNTKVTYLDGTVLVSIGNE